MVNTLIFFNNNGRIKTDYPRLYSLVYSVKRTRHEISCFTIGWSCEQRVGLYVNMVTSSLNSSRVKWYPGSLLSLSIISSTFPQWWTQRTRCHHLNQWWEDLNSNWCQCCHQEGWRPEYNRAPWKWGCDPHGCSHGDWPLTPYKSHCRSWSYVLLITSGPYIKGGFTDTPFPCGQRPVTPHFQEKVWLCLERNDCTDALKAGLYFHVCSHF